MRRGNIKYTIIQSFLVLIVVLLMNVRVDAAVFQGTVSSENVNQGSTFTVKVKFTASKELLGYHFTLNYDANILEYVSGAEGGGGIIQLWRDEVFTSEEYAITFKAKSAGTTSLKLETITNAYDIEYMDVSMELSKGSVTVSGPYSSNNKLSVMNVHMVYSDGRTELAAINPGFSADTLEYSLSIPANVVRLSIDATAEDSKAAVSVSGTRMDPGSNSTTVKVTAENGDVRKYVIYTEKEQEETTTPPPETTTPPPETTTLLEETTPPPEETTTLPIVDTPNQVKLDGKSYTISNLPEGMEVPEGYEQVEGIYKGQSYTALKGLSTRLLLLYLADENGQGALYIYDEKADEFILYSSVTIRQHVYTMFDIPEDVALPHDGVIGEAYHKKEITINDKTVEALHFGVEGMYLVYAMNWEGQYSLYYYDAKEETMLRYARSSFEDEEEGETILAAPQPEISQEERKAFEKSILKRNLVIVTSAVLVVILIGVVVILATALKNQKISGASKNPEEEEPAESEEAATVQEDSLMEIEKSATVSKEVSVEAEKSATVPKEEPVKAEKSATVSKDSSAEAKKSAVILKDVSVETEKSTSAQEKGLKNAEKTAMIPDEDDDDAPLDDEKLEAALENIFGKK